MKDIPIVDLATHPRAFVSIKALAEHLGCDPRTVARMVESGALPAMRVGRLWRIPTNAARERFHAERHDATS